MKPNENTITEDQRSEPYKGLRPYEETDHGNFFGRGDESKILTDQILANRLTLLFAASGVGKTSLLRAEILPKLRDRNGLNLHVIFFNDWKSKSGLLLKKTIMSSLVMHLEAQGLSVMDEIETRLKNSKRGTLKELVQFTSLFTADPVIVVLDQFENTSDIDGGVSKEQVSLNELADLFGGRVGKYSVLISMREDYAIELSAFRSLIPLSLFENFFRLQNLTTDKAKDAIVEPVRRLGFIYEDDLLKELVVDLTQVEKVQGIQNPIPSSQRLVAPSYLQMVCSELWEWHHGRIGDTQEIIQVETYKELGGARGLVERYLGRTLGKFTREEEQTASLVFSQLVTSHGAKVAYTIEGLETGIRMYSG